jgi:T1SS-143 domain-containing protein
VLSEFSEGVVMAASIVVAQGTTPPGTTPPKVVTVSKPDSNQAITIHLDGATKLDLSAIANENITLVHVGDRLIILFDNHAEVTIDPFYSDNGQPLPNITVELGPDHDVSSSQFATDFPVTTDQSVLPASGGPNSVSSGASFSSFTIDTFTPNGTGLALLGSEGANGPGNGSGNQNTPQEVAAPSLATALSSGTVTEGGLVTDAFNSHGGNSQGSGFTAHGVTGSLDALVTFGTGGSASPAFQFVSQADATAWLASLALTSHGSAIDVATITGNTLVASTDAGQPFAHNVFSLTLGTDGSWTFTLLNPLDHPAGQGANSLAVDLSGLVQAVDADGVAITLSKDFAITVTDDVPALTAPPLPGVVDEGALNGTASPGDLFGSGNEHDASFHSAASLSGSLAALVSFGADGAAANIVGSTSQAKGFQFAVANGDTHDFLVQSHGQEVNFVTIANNAPGADGVSQTLTAWTNGGPAEGGHEVFTLQLNGDGHYTFTLINPLDDTSQFTLDLSSLVKAVDFDGDAIALSNDFRVVVTDDAPVVAAGVSVSGTVNAGGLETDPDLTVTGGVAGQLDTLVHFGSDGPPAAPFQFVSNPSSVLPGLNLFASGELVDFATVTTTAAGTTLAAFTEGSTAGPPAFTLTLDNDGSWTFTLQAPLTQPDGGNTFDLSSLVQAVDFDGSVVGLAANALQVTVLEAGPVLTGAAVAGAVDEGGLTATTDPSGTGTDPFGNGNDPTAPTQTGGPTDNPTPPPDTLGSLDTLVHFVGSGPNTMPFQFTIADKSQIDLGVTIHSPIDLGLTSHGVPIDLATVSGFVTGETLTAYAGGTANPDGTISGGTQVFTLTINGDGSWAFTLLAPIDHTGPDFTGTGPEPQTVIDFSSLVKVVDANDHQVVLAPGELQVTITDDTPDLATGVIAALAGTVNEDGLRDAANAGTDPFGNGNGSDPVTTGTGDLDTFVSFGADGKNATPFQFVANASAVLAGLGMQSHDASVDTATVLGNTLTASTSSHDGQAGHNVFTLTLNDDGSWTVTLLAPIDHIGDQTFNIGGLVEAVDFDGDSRALAANDLQITITDDTPVVNGAVALITTPVNESGLPGTTDTHGTGSDLVNGIITASGTAATLQGLVKFGADGLGSFGFVTEGAAGTFLSNQPGLSSHGFQINHATIDSATNTLTALDSNSDPVFTLQVNGDGSWVFTLLEPLDDGPSQKEDATTIDLSGLVQATDFDGSPVTLANDFKITVTDDTPTLTGAVVGGVFEGGLTATTDPFGTGNDPAAATASGGSLGIQFGADGAAAVNAVSFADPAAINVSVTTNPDHTQILPVATHGPLTSHGMVVEFALIDAQTLVGYTGDTAPTKISDPSVVFSVVLSATAPNGSYDFVLDKPLDQLVGENSLNLIFSFTAQDFDGNTVTGSFTVVDTDDAPTTNDTILSTTIEEGGLESGNTTPAVQTVAAPGLTQLVNFGADGPGATAFHVVDAATAQAVLTGPGGLGLTSNGISVDKASVSGSTLTVTDDNNNTVFTLAVNGDGSFTFTLVAPIDGAPVNGTRELDISRFIEAIDFDGSTKTLAGDVHVEINNDHPVVANEPASGNENTPNPPSTITPNAGPITVTLSETDGSPAAVSFVISSLPMHGTLFTDAALTHPITTVGTTVAATGGTATLFFEPTAFFAGTTTFQYGAEDANGARSPATATVTIDVSPVADPPVVTNVDGNFTFTPTTADVRELHTVALAGGGFVATWAAGPDGHEQVFAQVFDANNQPVGASTAVGPAAATSDTQSNVVALAGGGFAMVWQSGSNLITEAFDAQGHAAAGGVQTVSTSDLTVNANAQIIVALANGDYAVVFGQHDGAPGTDDVYARIYDASGHAVTGPIQANALGVPAELFENVSTPQTRDISQVVATAHGFVVMWESTSNDGSGSAAEHTYVRAFNADGSYASPAIEVNTPSGTNAGDPAQVVALSGDDFAVMWQETSGGTTETLTRIFKASENYAGTTEIVTGTGGPGTTDMPSQIVELANGGYALVWSQGGATADVFAQVYDANGHPTGATPSTGIQVDSGPAAGFAFADAIVALAGGGFAVSYNNFSNEFVSVYDAQGHAVSGQIQLDSNPSALLASGGQTGMVALADGGFEAIWDQTVATANGSQDQIWAEHFDASGKAVGNAQEVFATTSNLSDASESSLIDEFKTAFANGTILTGAVSQDSGKDSHSVSFGPDKSVTLDFLYTATGSENKPIALFNASIPPDPTETLTITISGVPDGAKFEVNGTVVGAAGMTAGTWVISDPAQVALLATSPLEFMSPTAGTYTLSVDAHSVDHATLSTGPVSTMADTVVPITVTVVDVNDVTLSNPSGIGITAGSAPVSLGIGTPVDADAGSGDSLIITIQAVPGYAGGLLQYSADGGTTWTTATDGTVLTSVAELESLRYTPPASGSFTGDSVVYSIQDGASLVDGTIAINVAGTPTPGLYFAGLPAGNQQPDLYTVGADDIPHAIPLNTISNTGSDAGQDGGFIQFAGELYFFASVPTVSGAGGTGTLFRLGPDNVATPVDDGTGTHTFIGDPGTDAHFTIYDGNLYLEAQTSLGDQLVRIDADGIAHVIDVFNPGNLSGSFPGASPPGTDQSAPGAPSSGFVQFDGNLYFSAQDPADLNGNADLFRIDPNGQVTPVTFSNGAAHGNDAGEDGGFVNFADGLFFNAQTANGTEALFKLDANGVAAPVLDNSSNLLVNSGGANSHFHVFDNTLYFTEEANGGPPVALYSLDANGDVAQIPVLDESSTPFAVVAPSGFADVNGHLYFAAADDAAFSSPHQELFTLDTHGNAVEVTDAGASIHDAGIDGGFASFNGNLYFMAADANTGFEDALFEINGSTGAAAPVDAGALGFGGLFADLSPGGGNENYTVFDNSLYFRAFGAGGEELFRIDSTGAAHEIAGVDADTPTLNNDNGGFGVYTPIATVFGTDGNDHLSGGANTVFIGGKGSDTIAGAGTNDTAVIDSTFANASISLHNGTVTVMTADGTDTLTGIDRIQFADKGLLIVDPTGEYGFKSVQAAVNAATEGDTIFVLPGTYTDSTINPFSSVPGGLYIDTPNLTLQGVDATGAAFTSVTDANKALLPTIIPGSETDFGSNIFIGPDAANTTLQGLHLQAGPDTTNKLLEIWADNATVENNFLDVDANPATYALATGPNANPLFDPVTGYTGAIAIYFNDNGTEFTDRIASFNVSNNILDEGVDISNGVGIAGSANPNPNEIISNNTFEGSFQISTGEGRYDTIVLNGNVPGSGFLLESNAVPLVTGNHFGDNTTPFLMRGSDAIAANLPNLGEVQAFLAANGNVNTTYAYVVSGVTHDIELAPRDIGGGPFFSFAVTNTLDTLELALESPGSNNVFSGQEVYLQPGDTVFIQSGPTGLASAIDVNNLTIEANGDSAHLTLTMATTLADGEPIPASLGPVTLGPVTELTLADFAAGQGANVTVFGNNLGDTVTVDSGSDVLQGGTGIDTAIYTQALATSDFTFSASAWHIAKTGGASDAVSGFEKVTDNAGHTFLLVGGGSQFTTIQEAVNAANDGDTILLAPGTYTGDVTINGKAVNIEGLGGANGAGGAVLDGSITQTGTLDTNMTIEGLIINATGSQNGISFTPTVTGSETITVNNVSVTGASETGFAVNGGGMNLTVDTSNSTFAGNGIAKTSGGSGDIDFFEFLGGANFTKLQVVGTAQGTSLLQSGDNGIQIAGFDENTKAVTNPLGDITFENVSVTGTFAKTLVYIQGYDDASNLHFAGTGLTLGDPTTQTGWTSMFVDLGPQGPTYVPVADAHADLAGVTIAGWSFAGNDATFAPLAAAGLDDLIIGTPTTTEITGTAANDGILYNQIVGGVEHVDGGNGTDAEIINGTLSAGQFTYNINPTADDPGHLGIDITAGANNAQTATAANSAVTTINVEEIVLNLGNGGDTVLINGDLQGTGVATNTVTINGGTGNDTVNAGGITGTPVDVVFNGGGGNDTFISGHGNDTFTGSGLDTMVFSGPEADYSFSVNPDTGSLIVTDSRGSSGDGTDTLNGVSHLQFSDQAVTFGPVMLFDAGHQLVGSFTAIQDAVNTAAKSGDTIVVEAGTYQEQVLVDGKNLTLIGEPGAVIEAPTTLQPSFTLPAASTGTPEKFALIGVDDDANVTIKGFTIDGNGAGNQAAGGDFSGIYYWNASGQVLDTTVTGIRDGGPGGTFDGAQRGNAIVGFVTDGTSHTLEVGDNTVSDFQKTGIVLNGAGLVGDVHDNQVTGAGDTTVIGQNGIQIGFGAGGKVTDNTISGIDFGDPNQDTAAGVLVADAASGVAVNGNTVNGAAGDGDAGVFFDNSDAAVAHGNTFINEGTGLIDQGTFTTPVDQGSGNTYGGDTTNLGFFADATAITGYTITGTSGPDAFQGGAGNDTFVGNGGSDTAIFSGNESPLYTITFDPGTGNVIVADSRGAAGDGTDTLHNVANLQFADKTLGPVLLFDGSNHLVGDFTTIQAAVNAAGTSGDTVLVGAGTYQEQVLVDGKSLSLIGEPGAVIEAPTTLTPSFTLPAGSTGTPEKFALIGVENDANVTISGFTIDGNGAGNQPGAAGGDFAGIYYWNASGHVLDTTVTGIRDGGPGGTLDGAQHGNAIVGFVTDGTTHMLEVANSTVSDFQKTGILLDGAGLVGDIHDNHVTGAGDTTAIGQNGIQIGFGAGGTVTDNIISGIDFGDPNQDTAAGVLVFDAASGVTVNGNTVNGAGGTGDAGVFFDNADAAVAHNNAFNNLGIGLVDQGTFTTPVDHGGNAYNGDATALSFSPDATATTNYVIAGTSGPDDLEGALGNDTFQYADAQFHGASQTVIGGGGSDTLLITDPTAPVTISDIDLVNVSEVQTLKVDTSGGSNITLGAAASLDVGGTGHTLTLDASQATGPLTLDGTGMFANLKVLLGVDGNDVLAGGGGDDVFQFGTPPTAGNNSISNFNNTTQHDSFAVSAAGFGGELVAGQDLGAGGAFGSDGTTNFASSSERFHFDTANQTLYYSSTGSAATAIALAHIEAGVQLNAHDIHVVA